MFALVLIGVAGAFALSTWEEVKRVSIDRPEVQGPGGGAVAAEDDTATDKGAETAEQAEDVRQDGLQVFLLVGSDSREDLDDLDNFGEFGGTRADVVMAFMKTPAQAGILSLPRDLVIDSLCDGSTAKLSQMLAGCGALMNGPTLLTLVVEQLIGQKVDHFAMVDLAGFQEVVDSIGGYEICVPRPVRDSKSGLDLPAGCTTADGEQTLAWLRSRRTQELTSDGWRLVPGMNDLVRNERQRQFLIDLMERLSDFSSPQDVASTASAVAPYFTVDSDLSLVGAVDLAWSLRGFGSGDVEELEIPVYDDVSEAGAVLRPSEPIDKIVAEFLATETAGEISRSG